MNIFLREAFAESFGRKNMKTNKTLSSLCKWSLTKVEDWRYIATKILWTPYFCRKIPDLDIKNWGKKPLDLASKEEVRQLLMNPSVGSPKYDRKKQNMWRWALHFRLRTSTNSQLKKRKTSTTNKNKNTAQRVLNWCGVAQMDGCVPKLGKKHFTYLWLKTSENPASVSGCP